MREDGMARQGVGEMQSTEHITGILNDLSGGDGAAADRIVGLMRLSDGMTQYLNSAHTLNGPTWRSTSVNQSLDRGPICALSLLTRTGLVRDAPPKKPGG